MNIMQLHIKIYQILLFGMWLGTIRITWGNPQSGCSDICASLKGPL
jgi:hypothetical protein